MRAPRKALASLLMIAPLFGAQADWPAFRGNMQRTAYLSGAPNRPSAAPVWSDSLGTRFISSPSIAGGVLYIGGRDGALRAIDAETGHACWIFHSGGWIDASPAIDGDKVICGSRDGMIYALNKNDGSLAAALSAGLQLSSAAVTPDGLILSGTGLPKNSLSVYDMNGLTPDGVMEPKWAMEMGGITYSSPAVFGSTAVIAANNGILSAIDLSMRETIWEFHTGGNTYLSSPAIDDTTVYFAPGNYDRNVYAIDLMDGRLLWQSAGNGAALAKARSSDMISSPDAIRLLRLSPEHRLRRIEAYEKAGVHVPAILKQATAPAISPDEFYAYGDAKTSSVAISPEMVYVIQKEPGYPKPRFTLLALDKFTGEEAWRFSELRDCAKFGYASSPIVASNRVFFGWGEGKVYGLDAKTGAKVWEDSLHGDVVSSPAVADGKLFFATYDGFLYAYALGDTAQVDNFAEGTFCYPNPAKTHSKMQYYLPKPGRVEARLYDGAERLVKLFKSDGTAPAGKGAFIWDISGAANGVYFAILTVDYSDGSSDKKVLTIGVLK